MLGSIYANGQSEAKQSQIGTKVDSQSYDHYLALDWSQDNAAIARVGRDGSVPRVKQMRAEVVALQRYLSGLRGKRILTIEESTSTHWLYVELYDYCDRIVICDPYRNGLLRSGPKTDRIDAVKLCELLRGGLLHEVYHSTTRLYDVRRLLSAYDDLVKAGVVVQNQLSALYRQQGRCYRKRGSFGDPVSEYLRQRNEAAICWYRSQKAEFEKLFEDCCRRDAPMALMRQLPGVGVIGAVRIVALVIDAHRFSNSGKYLSYCGLVDHHMHSGSRYYGRRAGRSNRRMKAVYKTAALNALRHHEPVQEYYRALLDKGLSEHNARHGIARYLARVSYGMLKTNSDYDPYRWRKGSEK